MNAPKLDVRVLELEDSWETINAWFLEHDLTDGLPIVPPTEARVKAMTDYAAAELGWLPSDVIATLAPKRALATVEKIAANAVMAGVEPAHIPGLVAGVRG